MVELTLWASDATVLFGWLSSVDYDTVPVQHRAERQALLDLFTRFEESMEPPSPAQLRTARDDVARDMS